MNGETNHKFWNFLEYQFKEKKMTNNWICKNKGKCKIQKGSRKRVGYKCVESNCEYLEEENGKKET